MGQLHLIRHAQASFGSDDYDKLSDLGHKQSSLLGEYIASRHSNIDCLIVGEMRRHKETAQGITQLINIDNQQSDARWNEFDFNAVITAYLQVHPEQTPKKDAPRSDWYKVLKKAMLAWSENNLSGVKGETWGDFTQRVQAAMQSIIDSSAKNVVVVTSGGAMAVMLMTVLGTSVSQAIAFNLQIKNTSINHFYFNQQGFQLSSFNNVPHLDHPSHFDKVSYS